MPSSWSVDPCDRLAEQGVATVTATLRTSGLCTTALFDGATNGQRFRAYVTDTLVPVLKPNDTVILDNLPAHKVAGVRQAVEAAGARRLHLPPCSPERRTAQRLPFRSILRQAQDEEAFATLKALLRTIADRTMPDLRAAIRQTFIHFTPQGCRNCLAAAEEYDLAVAK